PDPDFMNIVALHRPAFTTRRGGVRFSRLGRKATIQTRRGTQIGARVHYYYDISPIAQAEEIEMQPLLSANNSFDGLYDIYANIDDEAPGLALCPVHDLMGLSYLAVHLRISHRY
ncbi:hypothetical protein H4F76_24725, partial [Enterobacter hormaechei]